jgi:hypothetical protein
MARLVVLTGVIVCLALSACGGGNDSPSTTTTAQASVHWSRCPDSNFGMSVAGMSCREGRRHMYATRNSTGTAESIRTSDPRTFTREGFDCTQFPLEDGFGHHIVCARGDQHVSWYSTP